MLQISCLFFFGIRDKPNHGENEPAGWAKILNCFKLIKFWHYKYNVQNKVVTSIYLFDLLIKKIVQLVLANEFKNTFSARNIYYIINFLKSVDVSNSRYCLYIL